MWIGGKPDRNEQALNFFSFLLSLVFSLWIIHLMIIMLYPFESTSKCKTVTGNIELKLNEICVGYNDAAVATQVVLKC